MAPVYALMISFALVLLGGFLLPETTPAAETPPKIRFVPNSAGLLGQLVGTEVELFGADHRQAPIDAKGEVAITVPDTPFMICAQLPPGWSATDPAHLTGNDRTCWRAPGRNASREDIRLLVSRTGAGR